MTRRDMRDWLSAAVVIVLGSDFVIVLGSGFFMALPDSDGHPGDPTGRYDDIGCGNDGPHLVGHVRGDVATAV